jgi:hypothetical protein
LASVVRRVRAPDASEWIIGIKRLSDAPLPVALKALGGAGAVGETGEYPAIYAPINADGARINGVVMDTQHPPGSSEFLLPTRRGTFHIRANRVIDRGERWMRLGFEVLAKK